MEQTIEFKGKAYNVKRLFVRDQSKMLRILREFSESKDEEVRTDRIIQAIALKTDIDTGDLNGCEHMSELLDLGIKLMLLVVPKPEEAGEKKAKEAAQS